VTITYSLNEDNEFKIEYNAQTDKPTIVNLTNHTYWNLAGAGSGTVMNHQLTLNSKKYLLVDSSLIPTGEIKTVYNTPMDFTKPKLIGEDIRDTAALLSKLQIKNSTWRQRFMNRKAVVLWKF